MIPYGKQTIEQDDIQAVVDVLKSDFLTTGPKIAEFEQTGLNYATGDFIGFLDSDDWIVPDMYEVLVEKMIEGVYDVVNCQLIRDKGNDEEANFRPEWGNCNWIA